MNTPIEKEIAGMLIAIISDGFNRSLGVLEKARAIDTKKMRADYKGVGSRYYDLVTEQIELTAKYGAKSILQYLSSEEIGKNPKEAVMNSMLQID